MNIKEVFCDECSKWWKVEELSEWPDGELSCEECESVLVRTDKYEPEKPVVPQFVADFYESIEDDFEDGVYGLCIQLYNCDLDGRINFWFGCNDNKPIETLVKMKLYGYEVEKEKLYTVEIPNPNGFIRLVLCKDCDGKLFVATFSGGDCWENFGKCKITESEIKQDFEWAWQFAEEVEE